jgi:hypothetical protein
LQVERLALAGAPAGRLGRIGVEFPHRIHASTQGRLAGRC